MKYCIITKKFPPTVTSTYSQFLGRASNVHEESHCPEWCGEIQVRPENTRRDTILLDRCILNMCKKL